MKILVTGGAGYIGSHTCVELIDSGHEVVIVDNFSNSEPKAIERICTLSNTLVDYYQLDICSPDLEHVFQQHTFDAVMHFAGLKAVGESTEQPLSYYENNVFGSVNLLKLMKKYEVKSLVFSSSATVYGEPELMPITETASLNPQSPYGHSKLMVEQICQDFVKAQSDCTAIILRYFNPVGAHSSGQLGENPNGKPNNLLPFISQVAMGYYNELYIFGDDYNTPDGTGIRDYIHVVDLAKGHVKALDALHNSKKFTAINLGTGVGYSVLDVVNTFNNENNTNIPYTVSARRPGDVERCYADANKAKTLLDWQATRSLADMVRDTWRWQTNNPKGY